MESVLAKQMARFIILAITLVNAFLLMGNFKNGYGPITYVVLSMFIGAFIFLCYAMFIQVEEEISIMFIIGSILLIAAVLMSTYPAVIDFLEGKVITSLIGALPFIPKVVHALFVLMAFFVLRKSDETLHFTWKLCMVFVFLSVLSSVIALVFQKSMCSAETTVTLCHLVINLLQQILSNFFGVIALILFIFGLVFNRLFETREPVF